MSTQQSRKETHIKGGGSGEGFSGWIENKLTFEFTNGRNFLGRKIAFSFPAGGNIEADKPLGEQNETRSSCQLIRLPRPGEQLCCRGSVSLPTSASQTVGLTAIHLPPTGEYRQRDEIIPANSIKGNL